MVRSYRENVEVEFHLRPAVSRPVCLGVRHPSGTRDQFFFLLEISFRHLRVYYFVAPSLTRGRVCNLLCNCLWALSEHSLLGRSPAELRPYFTVSSETPRTWRARSRIYIHQKQGGPIIPPPTGFGRVRRFDKFPCPLRYSSANFRLAA
jgi:hypothetical protein